MKKTILSVGLLFWSFFVFSQYIEGKVLDAKTNKPIEGVHVFMKGINRGTLTNEKGVYYLKFPYKIIKSDIIEFSHISYETLEIPFVATKNNYSVNLLIDIENLKEVEVRNKRNLKPTLQFKTLAKMKKAVYAFASVLNNTKIYVIGGNTSYEEDRFKKLIEFDPEISFEDFLRKGINFSKDSFDGSLQIYDVDLNKWEKPTINFRKRANHNIQVYNNQIYVLGGKRLSNNKKREYLDDKIEVFNLDTNKINIDDTNPHQALDFASFVYQNNLVVMGGSTSKNKLGIKQYSNKIHSFNLKTGLWYQVGNMPEAKETQGVLIDDTFYLVGGYQEKPLSAIESYNLVTGKWKKEANLFYGISKPAITNNQNTIYIFDNGKLQTYNVLTKELSQYLIDLYLSEAKLFISKNTLYIVGGFNKTNYSIHPSNKLYSIDLNEIDKTQINHLKMF
jgi:hypothetical protein